ncbi:MAG: flagellar biosynthesis anti-sigma factor FlgM [Rickettsiales bacterium]|nr:flagellar biosynthesis anti-sigma factor FlgM [Rickettsiales bacterium]RPG14266.1 MAG: flagellar biosynthesis anti-sigma factor FlgM [Pelagibacteraceae bacterium TMED195]|tara:strand:+ start:1228 stop:1542 length:315 start_codon:yes stop_codon:yes gene_type:complete
MVDHIKNNLSNLGSSGSSKVSSESKKSSSAQIKGINHSQAEQKFDSSEVSKFVTKEKIKDMAKEPPIDQAATTRIKNAIANGSYPIDLDKIADALFDAYKEMKE